VPHLVDACRGREVYVTTKYDGTSQTVYHHDGHLGGCSRNLELKDAPGVAVWELIRRYGLDKSLPLLGSVAIQWECVGPKIQGNPLGLATIEARAFNIYNLHLGCYMDAPVARVICESLGIPFVEDDFIGELTDEQLSDEGLRKMADGTYPNGKLREGIVIRPTSESTVMGERVSFKSINLAYRDRG
jgi:hypothetical protein